MRRGCDILVVGAGLTGLTMTALLASGAHTRNFRITLVDAGERPAKQLSGDIGLRVSAIAPGSVDLLERVGAWQRLDLRTVCPFDHMRVWDEDDYPDSVSALRFDADEFAVPHLGYIVENRVLQHALMEVLDDLEVTVQFATPVGELQAVGNGYRALFDNGGKRDADLVIAADGANSAVRSRVGIGVTRRAYEQTALVTHLEPEQAHLATAWQRFLHEGPIGLLPLADGRVSAVWSTSAEKVRQALELCDAKLGELLTDVSGEVLGDLRVAGPRGAFPLAAQHANDYVRHGVALIGDAAHTLHPLAGQGANLGLADAAMLAEIIHSAMDNGEHPGDRPVLRRYERARKGENASMMHFMTGLNRLFASDSTVLGELRRAGMALFNISGPVRRTVVGVALGGDSR